MELRGEIGRGRGEYLRDIMKLFRMSVPIMLILVLI